MKSGIEMGAGMEQQEKNEIRLELPENCPPEPVLAYFLEQGVIHLPDIRVVAADRCEVGYDGTEQTVVT